MLSRLSSICWISYSEATHSEVKESEKVILRRNRCKNDSLFLTAMWVLSFFNWRQCLLNPYQIETLQSLKVIYVTETKGKGTTCHYCEQILQTYQKMTEKLRMIDCYISSHLMKVCERIHINSEPISKMNFVKYFHMLWIKLESLTHCSELETSSVSEYPEFFTLLTIYIFIQENVNVVIIKTDIDRKRDSTNVFCQLIVTDIIIIELNHTETLSNIIEAIFWHKADIFKSESQAFTVLQDKTAMKILCVRAHKICIADELHLIDDKIICCYSLTVNSDMLFQRLNASLAISLTAAYLKLMNTDFIMTEDLACSVSHTQLLRRNQMKTDQNNIWLMSTAHNTISLKKAVRWFKETMQRSE